MSRDSAHKSLNLARQAEIVGWSGSKRAEISSGDAVRTFRRKDLANLGGNHH
jgi:hypothetical protein